jgi:flagellar biosynthesis protein FlhB
VKPIIGISILLCLICLVVSFNIVNASNGSFSNIKQSNPIDDLYQSFKQHPEAVFIVLIAWIILIVIFDRVLDISITPWIVLMCLLVAIFIGVWYMSTR